LLAPQEWIERRLDTGAPEPAELLAAPCTAQRIRWRAAYDERRPAFRSMVMADAKLERLATGFLWAEGPVYFGEWDALLFSDIPNDVMWCLRRGTLTVFRHPSNYSNGNTRDRQGRLVTCEHATRRVTRSERNGRLAVIAAELDGCRLNSPNDVVVSRTDTVWFTDPTYGLLSDYEAYAAKPEYGARGLMRCLDGERVEMMRDDFEQPNGLAFSPDESILYVADSGGTHATGKAHHVRALSLRDGVPARDEVLCEIDEGVPDGLRVDPAGNLWCSAADGVHVFNPAGELLGKILVPEVVANLCFGGLKGNLLYITASTSVYRLALPFSMLLEP
jgi:gluconolactonase